VLAARGKLKNFTCLGTKFKNPSREPLGVKQLTRLPVLAVGIAGIFVIKAAERGGKFFVHAASVFANL
jgi:hypothetical protein